MRIDSDQSSTSLQDSYNTGSEDSLSETSQSSSTDSGDRFGRAPSSGGDLAATHVQSSIAPTVVSSLMDSPDSIDHIPISVRRASTVSDREALPGGFEDLYPTNVAPSVPIVTSQRKKMVGGHRKGAIVRPKKVVAAKALKTAIGKSAENRDRQKGKKGGRRVRSIQK